MKEEKDDRKPHILNTSANLLGFCFIVLTSVKISKLDESTYIDIWSNRSSCHHYTYRF